MNDRPLSPSGRDALLAVAKRQRQLQRNIFDRWSEPEIHPATRDGLLGRGLITWDPRLRHARLTFDGWAKVHELEGER